MNRKLDTFLGYLVAGSLTFFSLAIIIYYAGQVAT